MGSSAADTNAPCSEREIVGLIEAALAAVKPPEIGIGDDAALVSARDDWEVATIDTMVEGVHFRINEYTDWADVGWKAIASNQSDIAAMGAMPSHALIGLSLRRDVTRAEIARLYEGMQAALTQYGGRIVGGDTVVSDRVTITVAMSGHGVGPADVLRIDSALPGDVIAVSGNLGDSRGGLAAIELGKSRSDSDFARLIERHNRPAPRTDLVAHMTSAAVRCATDISDGLLRDLDKICAASGVTARIELGDLPISDPLRRAFPNTALQYALSGGEDYELLVCTSHDAVATINSAVADESDAGLKVIGEIPDDVSSGPNEPSVGRVALRGEVADRVWVDVAAAGWDHWNEAKDPGTGPC